jgi:transcriptional regulator with XRE-family HTH domain
MVRGLKNPAHIGLPSRLKAARRLRDIKRRPLADAAGIAPSTVGDIEMGRQIPTVGKIAQLASALSVSAAWLGFGIGEMQLEGRTATCEDMGARLQAVRVERAVTKAELGRLAGLTAPSITQIEKGGQSGVEVIEALAKALGVSPGWLAFGIEPQVPRTPRRGRPPAPSTAQVG